MGYSQVALENKLLDMYPDITKNGFVPMMSFDQEKNAWAVKFKKDKMEFTVYLNREDADACIDGTVCEDFGIQIAKKLKTYSTYKKI